MLLYSMIKSGFYEHPLPHESGYRMPITASWNNEEKTIILITFEHPWIWHEFEAAYEQMDAMFKSVSHKTSLILNISNAGFPPPSAIEHFRRVSENRHANLDKIIVVGIPTFFRTMLNILRSVYQGRYTEPSFLFSPTLEKAYELLTNGVTNDQ